MIPVLHVTALARQPRSLPAGPGGQGRLPVARGKGFQTEGGEREGGDERDEVQPRPPQRRILSVTSSFPSNGREGWKDAAGAVRVVWHYIGSCNAVE